MGATGVGSAAEGRQGQRKGKGQGPAPKERRERARVRKSSVGRAAGGDTAPTSAPTIRARAST
eukprot:14958905-Heterocapsa_arctica.AAC.1